MNTIDARAIEEHGLGAVEEFLVAGPVHVLSEDRPRYVIVSVEHYQDLQEALHEAYLARIREARDDVAAGRVYHFSTTEEMMAAIRDFDDADSAPQNA